MIGPRIELNSAHEQHLSGGSLETAGIFSFFEAVATDLRGGRPSRGNPIVQNDRSFRDDGNINEDIEKCLVFQAFGHKTLRQRQAEAQIRKQARMQEGGRGGPGQEPFRWRPGGYNDRQDTVANKRAVEAESGYDDFGRRVVQREGDKKQRAQARQLEMTLKVKKTSKSHPKPRRRWAAQGLAWL